MHIPDGYLGPVTYGGLWAAMVPAWVYASKKIRTGLKAAQVPFLALSAAFSFVIMMFNIPIPAGTTGHATGATLIAILLGPWPAVMAVSIALFIQAFVFGDGGITAIGANCFNMAFAEVFVGYGMYRLVSFRFSVQRSTFDVQETQHSRSSESPEAAKFSSRELTGAAAGAYVGINAAALLTAVELGIQTMLHRAPDGRPLYSPFPLAVTVPAIMIQHVLIFGIVEAVVTVLVLGYLRRSHPELIRG